MAKIIKDPIYKTKVIVLKPSFCQKGDLDLCTNYSKMNIDLHLPQWNHVAKFDKDLIYRTKVIVWKLPLSNCSFIVTVTLTFDLMTQHK